MQLFRVALAQMNSTVGDIDGNLARIIDLCCQARDIHQARVVVFPELAVTGYPPEDLLLRRDFIASATAGLSRLCGKIHGICAVIGHPHQQENRLYNAASVIDSGQVIGIYHKRQLPNYGVFDEKRYFEPGGSPCVVPVDGIPVGITVCEDVWHEGAVEDSVADGARVILNLNGSPFHVNKSGQRENEVIAERARRNRVPILYVNLVGGQDELVFDGGSFVVGRDGTVTHRGQVFVEDLLICDLDRDTLIPEPGRLSPLPEFDESVYRAITTGVRDYVHKNGFTGVVLGLSGGIDSALTLAIAVDALGADCVEAVLMPSRYTDTISIEDAIEEAECLSVSHRIIDIEPVFEAFLAQLNPIFQGLKLDATEENLQSRIRGTLLMAISNKSGRMVLTTGNKSEMSVGYATLYGDMAGGFAAIKDVPKTMVYRLAEYRNGVSPVIPARVISRPPTAELAPDQKDIDSLPPYEILDPILQAYVEEDQATSEIIDAGYDAMTVKNTVRLVTRTEYKRRQAPPGVRITQRAFGRDRRYPITARYF